MTIEKSPVAQRKDSEAHADTSDNEVPVLAAGDNAERWLGLISAARKREKEWRSCARDTLSRYADERPSETNQQERQNRKVNILWSNTEVLMSHLCVDLGTPDVRRLFNRPGKNTKISKIAADVLEKVMTVEGYADDVAHQFEAAIEDHLLPGRGVCWLELGEAEDPDGNPNWLEAKIVNVPWERFIHGSADVWGEVPWVGRELLFSYSDLKDQFPKYADDIPLNFDAEESDRNRKNDEVVEGFKRGLVYEIWIKETAQRVYFAEGCEVVIKADDDPYRVKDFFPCGRPLIAVKGKKHLAPVPLYWMYMDQASELDRLTTRAYRLMESLKYCGIYGGAGNQQLPDIGDLEDGRFIPIQNAAAMIQNGGLAAAFMVRDLEPIALALKSVMDKKDAVVEEIYNITGIADIMRGITDPNETFGAQRLKSRFGSSRSARWQRKVQRFVRDHYRIKAELIAEHYSREQLEAMTGIHMPTREMQAQAKLALQQAQTSIQQAQQQQQQFVASQSAQQPQMPGQPPSPPNPQIAQLASQMFPMPQFDPDSMQDLQETIAATPWEDVQAVLRSNARRMFMVDVETDDTAFEDEEQQKEAAVEFMGAFGRVLQEVIPAVQQNPVLIPLAKEMTLFVADSYKVGKAFDEVISDTFDKLAKTPPPPSPDKGGAAKQADPQIDALKVQNERMRIQNSQQDAQNSAQKFQIELQQQAEQSQQDRERHQSEMAARSQELAFKQREADMKERTEEVKLHKQQVELAMKMAPKPVHPNGVM